VSGEKRDGARASPREQRHLAEIQIADRLVEVAARRAPRRRRAVPEEDLVQVQRQDVALREMSFQPARQDRLADLSLQRPLAGQERLRDLLRDGRAALRRRAGAQVGVSARTMPR
jgi:hypothetical protein